MSAAEGPSGAPDGVVWDGTAWVSPATGHRWDGTAWVAPPPAAPAGAGVPVDAPSRSTVFWQVVWRAVVVATVGGAVVATVGILGAVVVDVGSSGLDEDEDLGLGLLPLVALVGGWFGLLLGVVVGPMIAGVCAWRLVPYPGARAVRLLPRVLAVGLVALCLPLLFFGASTDAATMALVGAMSVLSLAGAWLGSGWLTRWYVQRVEPARLTR